MADPPGGRPGVDRAGPAPLLGLQRRRVPGRGPSCRGGWSRRLYGGVRAVDRGPGVPARPHHRATLGHPRLGRARWSPPQSARRSRDAGRGERDGARARGAPEQPKRAGRSGRGDRIRVPSGRIPVRPVPAPQGPSGCCHRCRLADRIGRWLAAHHVAGDGDDRGPGAGDRLGRRRLGRAASRADPVRADRAGDDGDLILRVASAGRRPGTTLAAGRWAGRHGIPGLVAVCVTFLFLAAPLLFPILYGRGFEARPALLVPLALQMVVGALAMGPILLLKARMTGKPLAGTRIITTLVGVPLVLVVASTQGLVAGVWAMLGQAAIYVWLVWRAAARSLRLVGTRPEPYAVLGVRIDPLGVEQAAEAFDRGHANGRARIVHQCNAYNLLLASKDPTYQTVMNRGDLNLPDGWPAVWAGRRLGVPVGERVAGADLCDAVFRRGIQTGLRHFFYGGTEATLERLVEHLRPNYPGFETAGVYPPPFRPLTRSERGRITALVNGARPDVVWVGLGTPKQDYWMDEFRDRLDAGVLVGVGAVFDFLSGTKRRAPRWMQRSGLEWLHRLASEPRRLWRRYILGNPEFVLRVAGQLGRERLRRTSASGRVAS